MNKTQKNKWIKALRSGKYDQGVDNLNDDGKYCCLGVYCEVTGYPYDPASQSYEFHVPWDLIDTNPPDHLFEKVDDLFGREYAPDSVYIRDGKLYCTATSVIPEFVAKPLGLMKKVTIKGDKKSLQDKLIWLNDDDEYNFDQIADYLEKVNF